ncbi:arabinan endo-1,5-alpha-L-arabinosidase [Neolewinella litorea]|uniref:Arabinan endo-1,5-alpha-L-arabinosidase n=1 Tax=Neolewinella litorea TaxID=2562452 RepID=A0A4S4NE13_9BACT|nr:arabinan endo-1,5-alpha-L-arabinosidase [Neolewinella litorea]THH36318.1 arabinan endo-1,5-alpha-L-arabinosidase [Neolewinella litorea]
MLGSLHRFLLGAGFGLALLSGAAAGAQGVGEIRVHDPVVIREAGTYHLFSTGRGIAHFTSPDLEEWTEVAPVFPEKPDWADGVVADFGNHIWAPDVVRHDGRYYLYYSVSAFGKNTSAIGVATSTTLDPNAPDYGWTDHGIVIRSYPNRDLWNAIDPNLIFDEGGVPWLSFGSFWNGLKLTRLDSSLTRLSTEEEWHTLARRERSFELADENPGDAALEAPFLFRKGDWYYLFLSWDLCCRGVESTYKVVVGRSARMEGPYFDRDGKNLFHGGGSLVLKGNENWYGAGHCSVYDFDGTDYLFFHAYDAADNGRPKLGVRTINWTADGWPTVEPLDR